MTMDNDAVFQDPRSESRFTGPPRTRRSFAIAALGLLSGAAAAQLQPAAKRARTAALVLTEFGFQPNRGSTTPGTVHFVFYNRSGLEDLTFEIARRPDPVSGVREVLTRRPKKKASPRHFESVSLSPGTYVISVEDRPEWSFELTVAAPERP